MADNRKIIDSKRYLKYTKTERGIFEAFKEGILSTLPTEDDKDDLFDDETIEYAEKFAFNIVDRLPDEIKNPIVTEQTIIAIIAQYLASINTGTGTTNTKPSVFK